MPPIRPNSPRVLVDADVLFAAAASPSEQGASLLLLRLAEITLIEAITCAQAIVEAERTLSDKLPQALPAFRLLVSRCLRLAPNPQPIELRPFAGCANPDDLPLLVTAQRERCAWLVTFDVRRYQPGLPGVTALRPGDFVLGVRDRLAHLAVTE